VVRGSRAPGPRAPRSHPAPLDDADEAAASLAGARRQPFFHAAPSSSAMAQVEALEQQQQAVLELLAALRSELRAELHNLSTRVLAVDERVLRLTCVLSNSCV